MYATQTNMVTRFGEQELIQLTDRAQPALETIDTAVLAAAMTRADALVDGYLRTRYAVPVVPTLPEIAHAAEGIARRYLYDDGAPEGVLDLYKEAINWLTAVQSGKALLDATLAPASTSGGMIGTAQFNTVANDFACRY